MHLWIDLANSPHVPFFKPLIDRFRSLDHEVSITARDFAETLPLAEAAGLSPQAIGEFGGPKVVGKVGNLLGRARALADWARERHFDLAISHNSYTQILGARILGIKSVTLMDYEFQPANHLAFRLASKVIVPSSFPRNRLRRYGAGRNRVRRYQGTKEDVYLADFVPDPAFTRQLYDLGIDSDKVIVLLRPPAHDALYHRFQNTLFDEALNVLSGNPKVQIILLPRNEVQRITYANIAANVLVPARPLNGPDLIAASDLVISAGGTINREAAALGVPAVSVYAGQWAAIDEQLVQEGRLKRVTSADEIASLAEKKKGPANPRRATNVLSEVVDLILN